MRSDPVPQGYGARGIRLNGVSVDGLGRLTDANETITKSSGSTANHSYTYVYDMRSQLTDANITNIGGVWAADYAYYKSGNMSSRTIQSIGETFGYTGHQMSNADGNNLSYDENGNLTAGVDVDMVWNWDNMLRSAEKGGDSISLRYDPSGNRIFKDSSVTGQRKYIVDIVSDLPVILLEIDDSNDVVKKTYIYANSQILAQHDGNNADPRYFFLHDRLGSVREVIDTDANVVRMYTYEPFGDALEDESATGAPANTFMFTGQYYDSEIDEYYLRARIYDSCLSRFTSRDPVEGRFENPLSLHRYLYCGNDPTNYTDINGEWALMLGASLSANFTVSNLDFARWQERTLNAMIRGASKGSLGTILTYYAITVPYFLWLAEHIGAGVTGGGAFIVAHDESERWSEGWSFGDMWWLGGGASASIGSSGPGKFGGSVTIDIGYSPEAQHVTELSQRFQEFGGSVSTPFPAWFGFWTGGFTASRGLDEYGNPTGIHLYTGSIGIGTKGWGGEVHGFEGYTWVHPWFE